MLLQKSLINHRSYLSMKKSCFLRQKGVASALLGRGQNELYSFLSDVQRWNPSSKIFIFKIGEIDP
jgi:hypothetical protein